uniref:Chromosome segregation ATPase n=1 Tax=Pithovirus LCPAC401 TaxID=2506595 RepID=A0A481ZC08_9VIRU|nr:MAG: chromosome segregation ATPase [Pithovirus LCPAC401]
MEMELSLANFKCYKELTIFKFVQGINLISGISGSGKSTILHAIEWCLYKRSIVKRFLAKNAKVTLKFPSFTINRSADGVCTEDIFITNIFGNKLVFQGTSYVSQNTRNKLIPGTTASVDKNIMEAFNYLTFRENPDKIIGNINDIKRICRRKYEIALSRLADSKNTIKRHYTDEYVNSNKNSKTNETRELSDKLYHLKELTGQLEPITRKNRDTKITIEVFREKLNELIKQRDMLPLHKMKVFKGVEKEIFNRLIPRELIGRSFSQDDMTRMFSDHINYERMKHQLEEVDLQADEVEEEIELLEYAKLYEDQKEYESLDSTQDVYSIFIATRTLINSLKMGKSIVDEYGFIPDINLVENEIETWRKIISIRTISPELIETEEEYRWIIHEQRTRLADGVVFDPVQKRRVQELEIQDRLRDVIVPDADKTMNCPNCDLVLTPINNKLFIVHKIIHNGDLNAEREKLRRMNEVKNLKIVPTKRVNVLESQYMIKDVDKAFRTGKLIKRLRRSLTLRMNQNELVSLLEKLKQSSVGNLGEEESKLIYFTDLLQRCQDRDRLGPTLQEFKCDPDPDRLRALKDIKITNQQGISMEIMILCNEYKDSVLDITFSIFDDPIYKSDTIDDLIQLKRMLENELSGVQEEYKFLSKEIKSLSSKINKLSKTLRLGIDDRYEKAKKDYSTALKEIELIKFLKDWRIYINAEKDESRLRIRGETASSLLVLAKRVEHDILISFTNTINGYLEDILSEIFPDACIILEMIDQRCKLRIYVRGIEREKIASLSGGEHDRVSIALTIAYSVSWQSPLIMLDECFNSLDSNLKSKCINMIRRYCPDKIIIVVSHEEEHGLYDSVIEL